MKRYVCVLLLAMVVACKQDNTLTGPSSPPQISLTITSIQPNLLTLGDQAVSVEITGTGFVSVKSVDLGEGIGIHSRQVPDEQHIRLVVSVKKNATLGTRPIVVTAAQGIAQKDNALAIRSLPPSVSFEVEPHWGTQLTVFTFDAKATKDPENSIRSYHWEFGDGGAANGEVVTHKFDAGGQFQVLLIVKDQDHRVHVEKNVLVEFFDIVKEKQEINHVVKNFLWLFDDLEHLSAEEIVVDFSKDPSCRGRSHEIQIIKEKQRSTRSSSVEILGNADVYHITIHRARCTIAGRFYGTSIEGTSVNEVRTHDFEMINENGNWRICNFVVY